MILRHGKMTKKTFHVMMTLTPYVLFVIVGEIHNQLITVKNIIQ